MGLPLMLANPAFDGRPSGRLGSKKTKTGCLTCKHARVKCDEHKPECKRCARLGLQCGYRDLFLLTRAHPQRPGPGVVKGEHSSVTPARQLSALNIEGLESGLFDFYRCEVAFRLGGFLDRDFWYNTILRLTHSEPVILHSVIALAAAFKQLRYSESNATEIHPDLPSKYYQRALREANRRTQQEDCELVTMLTCPMFLCMEFLQGNKLQAMALFRHGHRLLQSFVDRRQLTQPGTSGLGELDRTFYALFERLTLMSRMFGLDVKLTSFPGQHLRQEMLSDTKFCSLEEARNSLVRRLVVGREFMKAIGGQTRRADFVQHLTEHDRQEHQRLIAQQEQWYCLFQDLCQRLPPGDAGDAAMTATLTVFHFVAMIWLNCPFAGSQMSFDAYLENFQIIVAQVRTVISSCNDDSKLDGLFTFEMGVLPALYFTATKCRHLETRSQALELIRKAPKREGPWKRDELIVVAEEAIRLESAQLQTADEWPSKADRITIIKLSQHDDDDRVMASFIYGDHVVTKSWTDFQA